MFNRVSTMSTTCTKCDMEFSRNDALLRHKRNSHGTTRPYPQSSDAYPPSSQAYPPPPPLTPTPPSPPPEHVVLQHPFTMLLCGPTSSGKSCWMNKLLTPLSSSERMKNVLQKKKIVNSKRQPKNLKGFLSSSKFDFHESSSSVKKCGYL